MNLYTPAQAAEKMNLFHKGKPNTAFVKSLINDGELEYINFSVKNRRIPESAIQEYMERKRCPAQTKAPKSNNEKTLDYGASANSKTATGVGSLAATEASKRLKEHLRLSSSSVKQARPASLKTLQLVR